jgi:hypothetical protein
MKPSFGKTILTILIGSVLVFGSTEALKAAKKQDQEQKKEQKQEQNQSDAAAPGQGNGNNPGREGDQAEESESDDEAGLKLGTTHSFTGGDFAITVRNTDQGVQILIPDAGSERFVVYKDSNGSGSYRMIGQTRDRVWTDTDPGNGSPVYVVLALKRERNRWVQTHSTPGRVVLASTESESPQSTPPPPSDVTLRISTTPAGGLVILDNRNLGTAPVAVRVKIGTYSLSVTKEDYLPFKTASFVVGAPENGEEIRTNIVLKRVTASLNIETVPAGARILVNGEYKGDAPLRLTDLPSGSYRVTALRTGFVPADRTIVISSPEAQSVVLALGQESGAVRVASEPAGAMVYTDDVLRGSTPLLVTNLPAGPHRFQVRKDGFNAAESLVTVEAGTVKDAGFVLVQDSAFLSVVTVPEGAECLLDNVRIGLTPIVSHRISKGPHNLLIRKQNNMPYEEVINAGTDQHIRRDLVLSPLKATLIVRSVPEGAGLSLNGIPSGVTPFVSDNIAAGALTLVLSKPGYLPQTNRMTLTAGVRKEISLNLRPAPVLPTATITPLPAVEPAKGYLTVNSDPVQSEVFLNGQSIGLAPSVTALLPGRYTVEVVRSGYERWTETVSVEGGRVKEISAHLDPVFCNLTVESVPAQADVELNNVKTGQTPINLNLKSGSYVLRVRKPGFAPWSETLVVPEGLRTLSRTVILTQSSAVFTFNTSPAGASTFLNGRLLGVTPFQTPALNDGSYNLLYRLDGYRDWTSSFTVAGGQPSSFQAKLQPYAGNLLVLADPSDADVIVDTGLTGKAGTVLRNIPTGYRQILVRKFGYYDYASQVLIQDNAVTTNTVKLQARPKGRLVVDSVPSGATVSLDGQVQGVTPLSIEWPEGSYQVRLKKSGYRTFAAQVLVQADQTSSFNGRLVKGSDCCLCNSWFGKPGFWYLTSAASFGVAGYGWYKEGQLYRQGKKKESAEYGALGNGMGVLGGTTLCIGIIVHLAR